MSTRLALPNRRNHITQKVKVAGLRTLSLSFHDDAHPVEIFLRLKGPDCSSELIGLYDVIARLMSLSLQYGAPLEKVFTHVKILTQIADRHWSISHAISPILKPI